MSGKRRVACGCARGGLGGAGVLVELTPFCRLLLLRPRRRNASRATCEAVLPVLPALRLACVRYSAAAGALDIEALLARGIELPPHRAEQDGEWLLAAASGPQWLALRSRDT